MFILLLSFPRKIEKEKSGFQLRVWMQAMFEDIVEGIK